MWTKSPWRVRMSFFFKLTLSKSVLLHCCNILGLVLQSVLKEPAVLLFLFWKSLAFFCFEFIDGKERASASCERNVFFCPRLFFLLFVLRCVRTNFLDTTFVFMDNLLVSNFSLFFCWGSSGWDFSSRNYSYHRFSAKR